MKKLLLSLLAALFLLPGVVNAAPLYHGYEWDIRDFTQNIEVKTNGKIVVEEVIVADFTNKEMRGIEREIPIKYRDAYGNPFKLRFNLLSITDENGAPHPVDTSTMQGDNYYLRIGEASTYINEVTTYHIKYEIENALGYFGNHDELYWNAYTTTYIPILNTTVNVTVPEDVRQDNIKATCYSGYYGSNNSDCAVNYQDEHTISISSNGITYPYDGFTIVTGWPKGFTAEPTIAQKILWFIQDNWSLIIPVLAFIFLYLKWWYTGRDPKTKDTIIPRYKPPEGLSPTEVGTIIDEKVDLHDVSAILIDFAVRGYIKITEIKKKKFLGEDTDYELTKLKEYMNANNLKRHEKDVLDEIFKTKDTIKISKLKYKFYKKLETVKKDLYKDLVTDKFFVHNPDNVRSIYMGIGIFLAGSQVPLGSLFYNIFGLTFVFSVIATGVLFILFGRVLPRKTLKGAKAYIEIKGLEEYIRTAEKDRIKFQEDQNLFFEKLLPYAMVLGLGEKWAEAFKDLYKKPPAWFDAGDVDGFNSYRLVNSLNRFNSQTTTAFASSPRSSGGGGSSAWSGGSGFSGGFSGGGFGGGSVGGW